MKKIFLITALFLFTGCSNSTVEVDEPKITCKFQIDSESRKEIFRDCLDRVPKQDVKRWNRVIDKCEDVAYYQSREKVCE